MSVQDDYLAFLASKAPRVLASGLDVVPDLHPALKPHQRDVIAFGLKLGRWGCFLDTGLGKTFTQLEWSKHAAAATNGHALILTPLAVAAQIVREGVKYGYNVRQIRSQAEAGPGINVCNYDRLEHLTPAAFGSVALDESSILKSFTGKTTRALIDAFAGVRFRMAATATPAPNDHMELGNHAEFLGIMSSTEMLTRFFINDTGEASQSWRLKRHAEQDFWDWMASWARMAETPADLGHDASEYVLPPLRVHRHKAAGDVRAPAGLLFAQDVSAANMYLVKRETANSRAKMAAQIYREIAGWTNVSGGSCEKTPSTRSGETTTSSPQHHIASRLKDRGLLPLPTLQSEKSKGCDTSTELTFKTMKQCLSSKTELAPSAAHEPQEATAGFTLITATHPDASVGCFATDAMSASGISSMMPKISDEPHTISTVTKMPALVLWCDTNDEQTALEREFGDLAVSITGSMTAEKKEALHRAWLNGERPVMITKPSIFGWGVNWQHCQTMIFAGRSFSYEAWYQAVRRCWRFGQTLPVDCHLIVAEGEDQIGRVIDRKSADHTKMKRAMAAAMKRAGREDQTRIPYMPTHKGRLPQWLTSSAA